MGWNWPEVSDRLTILDIVGTKIDAFWEARWEYALVPCCALMPHMEVALEGEDVWDRNQIACLGSLKESYGSRIQRQGWKERRLEEGRCGGDVVGSLARDRRFIKFHLSANKMMMTSDTYLGQMKVRVKKICGVVCARLIGVVNR